MEISKKDYVKQHLAPINKELNTHGGKESKIKLTALKPAQIEFLYDLMTLHLEEYKDFARREIQDFHSEDMKRLRFTPSPDYKLLVHVHGITIPEAFDENVGWELLIGRSFFGSTQMVLTMKGWNIDDQAIV